MDSQELYMQKLWNLQRLLYKQLNHLRQFNSSSDAGSVPIVPLAAGTYPIDQILGNTQAFVDLVTTFKACDHVPTPNSSRSTGRAGEEASEARWGAFSKSPDGSSARGNGSMPEMDMPTVFALLSCYARLIDVYDEMFRHFARLLPSLLCSWGQSADQLGLFPQFQLGEFCLWDGGRLQVGLTVNVLLHALRFLEKTMGLFGRNSAAGGDVAEPDGAMSAHGPQPAEAADGVLGRFGRDKLAQAISILEMHGSGGGLGGNIGSLRGNIKKVNELLERG
jgi:hypothetical protein